VIIRAAIRCKGRAIPIVAALSLVMASGAAPIQPSAQTTGRWRNSSMEEYRQHLISLAGLVQICAKARDVKSCDPSLVGPDDNVPLGDSANADRRLIRYGWLRVLFSKAEDPDQSVGQPAPSGRREPDKNPAVSPRPTTSQLLLHAEKRLGDDLAQASGPANIAPAHAHERDTMKQVLAGPDFRNLEQPTVRDSILEKIGNWLNRFFESAASLKTRSAWVGRVLVWGFTLAVCIALVWGLLQLERRWRIRLTPETERPGDGAASARDWQLWLEDARKAADAGQWREAIHFVYWASISRLESKRLWPADRARTPREYLALVAADDSRKTGLAQLTGSFERTWYGGRPASETDYEKAERLSSTLISSGAANVSAVQEDRAR
jgi:hypothetical protein